MENFFYSDVGIEPSDMATPGKPATWSLGQVADYKEIYFVVNRKPNNYFFIFIVDGLILFCLPFYLALEQRRCLPLERVHP